MLLKKNSDFGGGIKNNLIQSSKILTLMLSENKILKKKNVALGIPVSSTNKTDHHDIAEILLKVALNTIYPAISTFAVQICYTNKFLLYSY